MTSDVPPDERYRADDGCPLFSPRLEEHLVAVTRGEVPNRGRFCGHCYTPMSPATGICPHCGNDARAARPPVDYVPDEVLDALRVQRKTESRWVNGFAYTGLLIATLGGLAIVLWTPVLRDSLIWATVTYALILLIGGRGLAGILGGHYGDRIGYEKARAHTRAVWEEWLEERDLLDEDDDADRGG